jgi:hypothetical protein
MYRTPTITTAELICDGGVHIPAGSAVDVSHFQTGDWNREAGVHTMFRIITFEGALLRVREDDLLAGVPR